MLLATLSRLVTGRSRGQNRTRVGKTHRKSHCCAHILTETCLHHNTPDQVIELDAQLMFQIDTKQDPAKKRGGRVCVYISEAWCSNTKLIGFSRWMKRHRNSVSINRNAVRPSLFQTKGNSWGGGNTNRFRDKQAHHEGKMWHHMGCVHHPLWNLAQVQHRWLVANALAKYPNLNEFRVIPSLTFPTKKNKNCIITHTSNRNTDHNCCHKQLLYLHSEVGSHTPFLYHKTTICCEHASNPIIGKILSQISSPVDLTGPSFSRPVCVMTER